MITDAKEFAGSETYLVRLVEALGRQWDFVALLSDQASEETQRRLQNAGAHTQLIRGLGRRPRVGALWELWRAVGRIRPTIAHINLTDQGDASAVLLVARLWRHPTVATLNLVIPSRGPVAQAVRAWLVRGVDRVIAVSESVATYLRTCGVRPVVVHYGLPRFDLRPDGRQLLGVEQDRLVVGGIGRLHHHKGWDVFCRAAEDVRARLDGVAFVVIGAGDRLSSLHGTDGCAHVSFVGYREAASTFLGAFDIMVVPSRSEAFGLVALEAMMAGVPVVASDVGGLPEVVGDCGILVPPERPDALADAIVRLAEDPDLRGQLAAKGRKRAADLFEVERMGRETAAVYEDLATSPTR